MALGAGVGGRVAGARTSPAGLKFIWMLKFAVAEKALAWPLETGVSSRLRLRWRLCVGAAGRRARGGTRCGDEDGPCIHRLQTSVALARPPFTYTPDVCGFRGSLWHGASSVTLCRSQAPGSAGRAAGQMHAPHARVDEAAVVECAHAAQEPLADLGSKRHWRVSSRIGRACCALGRLRWAANF